ncbi:hypothetical protein [Halalkalibacter akibai]|uniref:Uncharacterized protein n=1 Tax=Halalkalibacter akibai (strain ATCC 43226 / DSM 21942 / CIP 109018 / JCM 9157 / 1139) TaxID=1236973 RepID=W4QQQ9_HALA3|nr:hypothetical protein [Halalkalibacter akibai]GAE34272.1 hypothetical protein JCM9157_1318 [Halalkalibacter akibai JCM 9157]
MLKRTYGFKNDHWKKTLDQSGMELREFTAMSLEKVKVKSKKKRIRQKALKRALSQKEVAKEILLMVQKEKQDSPQTIKQEQSVTLNSVSVRGLPVTFLLKLGKKYFKEADVVRFYYNADKEVFYKNKELLVDVVETESKNLQDDQYDLFLKDVQAELEKRAAK